jgi:hypothetical protein
MPYNASNIPLSTIASRLNRRWDRLRLDHAQAIHLSMIFSENRYPLFRIMLDKQKRKQNAARRMSSNGPHQRMRLAP